MLSTYAARRDIVDGGGGSESGRMTSKKTPTLDKSSAATVKGAGLVTSQEKNWLLRTADSGRGRRLRSVSPSPATILRLARRIRRVSVSVAAELSRPPRPRTVRKQTSSAMTVGGETRCCKHGPGYANPKDAMAGPREKVIFVTCPRYNSDKPDMIATVDVDPTSDTYCTVCN